MPRRNPLGRVLGKMGKHADGLVSVLRAGTEAKFHAHSEGALKEHPPIFLIGAPRSGSTLLYKVITEHFEVGYFTNQMARWYKVPAWALQQQLNNGLSGTGGYEFRYGNVEGDGAPSEAGAFWYRWFQRGMAVGSRKAGANLKELRAEIGAITSVWGAPLAVKNLYNTLRIDSIMEALPESNFIVCRRNLVDNALSILKGRIDNLGDKAAWWSAPPREVSSLRSLPYPEQVVQQVLCLERAVDEARAKYGHGRFFDVNYEWFCSDVQQTMSKIESFMVERGHPLRVRPSSAGQTPPRFELRVPKVDDSDRELVRKAAEEALASR